ncbi:MAG: hypothetical protein MJ175_05290 [Clostridia bacterium]|nr:hypothetical protein [Clostridia bacterium]
MKHNICAWLLLGAMLTATAATTSCGDTAPTDKPANETTPATNSVETEAEPEDSLTQRLKVDDGIETIDYGGKTFTILGDDACEDYYTMAEQTGDVLDDAVFQRNSVITERFNINIEAEVREETQLVPTLKSTVMAGDDAYQLFAGHIIYAGQAVCDGYYYNWYDMPHIDFSKPWWSDSNVEDLTYDGKAFLAMGDFALTTIASTYCFFFNKQIAADYDLPDMYQLVNDGKWTADTLISMSKDIYRDLNGDGKADENDFYGYAIGARSPINVYLWSFGEKLAKKQEDGTIVMDYFNDKVVDIYAKLNDMTWGSEGVFARCAIDTFQIPAEMFRSNQVLFLPEIFDFAAGKLREFNTDYGIIPFPKWDEAQADYYTMVDGGHEGLAIPASISDPDFVGNIVEVLNAESWKRVIPTYYDVVLKTKGTRDEVSVSMLDYILDHRVFDFGYVYGQFGAAFWPQYLAEKKSADIASYYQKNYKAYDKTMSKVFAFFEEYEK